MSSRFINEGAIAASPPAVVLAAGPWGALHVPQPGYTQPSSPRRNQSMLRTTAVLMIAVLATAMTACALDPTAGHLKQQAQGNDPENSQVEAPPVAPESMTSEEASITGPVDDVITPRVNCSQVNFCNVPNSTEGAQCQVLNGCSLLAAQNECKREAPSICGTPLTCPFVIVNGSQHITMNCDGKPCSGGAAIACGGRCCSTSAKFCGSGGQCCDGVTPTPGCPT